MLGLVNGNNVLSLKNVFSVYFSNRSRLDIKVKRYYIVFIVLCAVHFLFLIYLVRISAYRSLISTLKHLNNCEQRFIKIKNWSTAMFLLSYKIEKEKLVAEDLVRN